MAPTTTYITDKRDAELAREVLDTIEAEAARRNRNWEDYEDVIRDGHNAWNQGTWGEIWLNELPASTDVEVVSPEVSGIGYNYGNYGSDLVSISGGLACGTAMCFAGHVVNMVGDRPVLSIDKSYTQDLHTGKLRKNLKRWMNKVRRQTDGAFTPSTSATISTVVTPEGRLANISERAQELLGLSFNEADTLFNGGNELPELRKYVARMEEGRNLITGRKKGKRPKRRAR